MILGSGCRILGSVLELAESSVCIILACEAEQGCLARCVHRGDLVEVLFDIFGREFCSLQGRDQIFFHILCIGDAHLFQICGECVAVVGLVAFQCAFRVLLHFICDFDFRSGDDLVGIVDGSGCADAGIQIRVDVTLCDGFGTDGEDCGGAVRQLCAGVCASCQHDEGKNGCEPFDCSVHMSSLVTFT